MDDGHQFVDNGEESDREYYDLHYRREPFAGWRGRSPLYRRFDVFNIPVNHRQDWFRRGEYVAYDDAPFSIAPDDLELLRYATETTAPGVEMARSKATLGCAFLR